MTDELRIKDYGEPGPPEGVPTWDTQAVQRDFEVIQFLAPLVFVRRRSDGVLGTMEFSHLPRFYWGFVPNP